MTNKDKLIALDIKLFAELFISHIAIYYPYDVSDFPDSGYESSILPHTSFYTFEDALDATIDWLESNG